MRDANCEILENDLFRFRNESCAFELTACDDLWLHNSFFLSHTGLLHILLLKDGKLRMVLHKETNTMFMNCEGLTSLSSAAACVKFNFFMF